MADLDLRPRTLVPSEREGPETEGQTWEAPASPQRQPRRPLHTLWRSIVAMNPRMIAGGGALRPLIVLALFNVVTQWDDAALGVLLPEIRAEFAFDMQFLLTLQSVMRFAALSAAPALGYLADRVSRVWLLRIGGIVSNTGSILAGLAQSIPTLTLGRAVTSLGIAVPEPAGLPLITDYYPSTSRARVLSFLGVFGLIGALAGPIVGGNLGIAYGWRTAVITLSAVSLGVSLLAFTLREPARGAQDRIEMGVDPEEADDQQTPVSWSESWRAARRITTVRRLWYAAPFVEMTSIGGLVLLQVYWAEIFGLDARARGTITAVNFAFAAIGLAFSGVIADRILARNPGRLMTIIGLALAGQAVTSLVVAFSPWLGLSIAMGIPKQILDTLFFPAVFTLLSLTVPARIRGLGLQSSAPWRLAGILALPLLGSVADAAGIRVVMAMMAPLYLIAAFIIGTAASGVARDIRSAKAQAMATREARASKGDAMLVARDVDVHYDGVQVLFGVDLDVRAGELVALLGTNGAGKSTLLRAIGGITQASGGAILIDGRDSTHAPPHQIAAAGISLVPGGRGIFPGLTVEENLKAAAHSDYRNALQFFPELEALLTRTAGSLSGGEQQMLALAQAFLQKPKLLLIDELSLGLAPAVVDRLLSIVRQIWQSGTTVILVEQSLNVSLELAERAVFMEKGRIVYDGPAEELAHRGDIVRSIFLGSATSTGASLSKARQRKRATAEPILVASGLHVRFGGVHALRGASLNAEPGTITGIIGPNGAGKTTLFDALTGLVDVAEGSVLLEGAEIGALAPESRARLGLGRSFQAARLFPTMTTRDTIAVAFERTLSSRAAGRAAVWAPSVRREERRIARRVDGLVELLGLQTWAEAFVGELSTATRRIVDLACVMASTPRVLLLDEPSSGLSQAETEQLGPLLERIVRETGAALILIEHDIPLVTSVSQVLVAMHLGETIASGSPAAVVADPRVVSSYLSASDAAVKRSGARRPDPNTTR